MCLKTVTLEVGLRVLTHVKCVSPVDKTTTPRHSGNLIQNFIQIYRVCKLKRVYKITKNIKLD